MKSTECNAKGSCRLARLYQSFGDARNLSFKIFTSLATGERGRGRGVLVYATRQQISIHHIPCSGTRYTWLILCIPQRNVILDGGTKHIKITSLLPAACLVNIKKRGPVRRQDNAADSIVLTSE